MQKITLFFLAVMTAFVISSCSKTEEIAPVTVVGIWNATEIGAILDSKTYKAPPGKEFKEGTSTLSVKDFSYEFKNDGTGIFGDETAKYTLSTDGKKLVIITPTYTVNLEVTGLTATELKLSTIKLTKKAGERYKSVDIDALLAILNSTYAIIGNGGTTADITNSTSIQGTITFKRP